MDIKKFDDFDFDDFSEDEIFGKEDFGKKISDLSDEEVHDLFKRVYDIDPIFRDLYNDLVDRMLAKQNRRNNDEE